MNKNDELRHHIAKTYLEGFRKINQSLYVYDYNQKTISPVSTKSLIFSEKYFYTDDTEEFLSKMEEKFSKYKYASIGDIENIINQNLEEFSLIMSIFFYRSKYQKELWSKASDKIIKNKILIPIRTANFPIQNILNNFSSEPIYIIPPEKKDSIWNELEQNVFEESILKSKKNQLRKFVENSIKNNKYKMIFSDNMFTTENPVIVLDSKNKPVKFNSKNIKNLIFTINSSVRIILYKNSYIPIADAFLLYKNLLENNYCDYLICGDKNELEQKLNKYKFKYIDKC